MTFLLAILATAAAVTAVYFYRENRALRGELEALHRAPVKTAPVRTTRAELTAPATSAEQSANAAHALAAPPPPVVVPPPATGENQPRFDRRDRGQEFFARALADPEARAAMLTRAKGQIDRMFGDYFVKLGLDETQIEALRTLLAERQMARMESGMLERSAETDQERAEAQDWREARLATTEADINAILGADGLKNLQGYLDSAPQRQVVDDIARRATYAGAPLSSEANDRLLDTVRQASADIPLPQLPGRGGWNGGEGGGGGRREPVTAEVVSNYMQGLRARNQQIIEQAKTFLTQPQLESLADQQIDEMQQAEAQLNFMVRNPDARGPGFGGGGGRGSGGGG